MRSSVFWTVLICVGPTLACGLFRILCGTDHGREALLSEVMRPATTTHMWRDMMQTIPDAATDGLSYIECATPQEEGVVIALMMRHTLCTPEKTCALVTPDRDLARRVASELRRWGLAIDDSVGRPLAVTPPGAFYVFVLRWWPIILRLFLCFLFSSIRYVTPGWIGNFSGCRSTH